MVKGTKVTKEEYEKIKASNPKPTLSNRVGKKGVPDAGKLKEYGMALKEHAIKKYKEHAPKVLEHAKRFAKDAASKVVDEGASYLENQAKAHTPSAAHSTISKIVGKGKDYVKDKIARAGKRK